MPSVPYNSQLLAGSTLVVPGLTNAGFIEGLAIDTCEDEAPFAGVPVDRLAVTHGHADHFSTARALRESGARVAVARDDASLVENPDINIRGMFSWAKPSEVMITRLFRGEPCTVDEYLEDWRDERAQAIPLPGHTLGHHGFLTADGVLFTGDALYLKELWSRHPLPYAIDPGLVVSSLERIAELDCTWLVPGHGHAVERDHAEEHIRHHIAQVAEIEELILTRLVEGRTTEQAIALVSEARGLSENPAAYWLAVTTVKGFLGELLGRGDLEFYVHEHSGWWRTVR